MIDVRVSDERISLADYASSSADCGAEAWFIGKVRDHRDGRKVLAVEYDAFEPLAENVFRALAMEARANWGNRVRIAIAHRRGRLAVGEISVLIRAESPHRAEAFAVCRFVIEEIKKRAPVWKKEIYENGESEWVQGHALCRHEHDGDRSCRGKVDADGAG